jgi:carboxypeptidase Q
LLALRRTLVFAATAALVVVAAGSYAADKKPSKPAEEPSTGWNDTQMQQPTVESIDLNAYNAIREEGLERSHVMDYAGGLADGIGPRLTGSPNMAKANAWTQDQLARMGCANAHLEDWGEFGMGWRQLNTWVRMTEPDTAIFVAQATPWSPSTNGPVTAQAATVVIEDEKDISKYEGKLAGKIVLLGAMRDVPVPDQPFFRRDDEADLKNLESLPIEGSDADDEARLSHYRKRRELREKVLSFLSAEKVAGVIVPS